MAFLRNILIRIGLAVDGKGFDVAENRLAGTKKRAKGLQAELQGMRKSLQGGVMAAKAMAGALIGHQIVKSLTTDYVAQTDAQAKYAKSVGVSVQWLAGMEYAAQQNGTTVEKLRGSTKKLAEQIYNAANGSKEAQALFSKAGVEYKNQNGTLKTSEDLYDALADSFSKSENGANKVAIAQKLLGDSGVDLIPTLNRGSAGLAAMRAEAVKLGQVPTDLQAANAEKASKAFLSAKLAVTGVRNILASALLPTITALAQSFSDWVTTGNNAVRMATLLGIGIKIAVVYAGAFIALKFGGVLIGVAQSALKAAAAIRALAISQALANATGAKGKGGKGGILGSLAPLLPMAPKLLLIGAAIGGIVYLFSQMNTLAGGGSTWLSQFMSADEAAEIVGGIKESLADLWASLKAPLQALGQVLTDVGKVLFSLIGPIVSVLTPVLGVVIKGLTVAFKILAPIIRVVSTILKFIFIVLKPIFQLISLIVTALADLFEGKFTNIGKVFGRIGQAIRSVFGSIYDAGKAVADKIQAAYAAVGNALMSVWDGIKSAFMATYNFIKEKIEWIAENADPRTWVKRLRNFVLGPSDSPSGNVSGQPTSSKGPSSGANVYIDGVQVSVNSAPTMSPQELQGRITNATKDALAAVLQETYSDRAEVPA